MNADRTQELLDGIDDAKDELKRFLIMRNLTVAGQVFFALVVMAGVVVGVLSALSHVDLGGLVAGLCVGGGVMELILCICLSEILSGSKGRKHPRRQLRAAHRKYQYYLTTGSGEGW